MLANLTAVFVAAGLTVIGYLIRQPLNEIRSDIKEIKETVGHQDVRLDSLEEWRIWHRARNRAMSEPRRANDPPDSEWFRSRRES